jgi:glycosyltransferase involved in cell wall biosynthesis
MTLTEGGACGTPAVATRIPGHLDAVVDGTTGILTGDAHHLAAALAEIARNHGPRDAVVEVWNGMPFFSPLWTRSPKVTVLHHVHAEMWKMVLAPSLATLGETIERRWAPPVYRGQRIVTLSQSSKDDIVDDLGFDPTHITVVPPGVDPVFRPADWPRRPPAPNVVTVGRLVPVKRLDMLIRACAEARRSVPDLTLTLVGAGYEDVKLDRLVTHLDAHGWVTFTGSVTTDQVIARYQQARIVASASAREGWGMTLTEAGACGTPAVATRIPGHLDAVVDGTSGILTRDAHHLAAALAELASDDEQWKRLSAGAREHASHFTWDATALGMMRALTDEMAGGPRRGRTGRWR